MDDICRKLTCTNPAAPEKCFTSAYPAADGTTCALNNVSTLKMCTHRSDDTPVKKTLHKPLKYTVLIRFSYYHNKLFQFYKINLILTNNK